MVLEGRQKDYEIRELSCSREAGALRLRWRYKKATDFLIFVYDSRQAEGFSLETALEELVDTAVMDEPKKLWSPGRAVSWKLMHKTKAEFVRDGKSVAIPVSELDKNVPYGICVFACRLEEEDEEKERLHVYPSDAQENTWFLPVKAVFQRKVWYFVCAENCGLPGRRCVLPCGRGGVFAAAAAGVPWQGACDYDAKAREALPVCA